MAAPAISAQSSLAPRIQSVDAIRGAIMILMAIDHIRDYVARSAMQFSPTDLTRTTAAIFFTRWITHFCAPVFMPPPAPGTCRASLGMKSNQVGVTTRTSASDE
jgi:hypothetical protein